MFVLKTKLKLHQKPKKKNNKNPNELFLYNHLKNIKNTLLINLILHFSSLCWKVEY